MLRAVAENTELNSPAKKPVKPVADAAITFGPTTGSPNPVKSASVPPSPAPGVTGLPSDLSV